jgi:DNA-binding NtrC family response regulator
MEPLFTTEAGASVRVPERVGTSAATERVRSMANRAADSSISLLILGEPGVGKTTMARWIHARSPRRSSVLVTVDCALSESSTESAMLGSARAPTHEAHEGAFEAAGGGTVLLERVDSLRLDRQAKLLRVLETRELTRVNEAQKRPVDARVIATSCVDLERATHAALFRADLLYRLGTIRLTIPPLRTRPEDIELLARHFLAAAARGGRTPEISPELLALFRSFAWPRNLTQLREVVVIARARCEGPVLSPAHVDVETLASQRVPEAQTDLEDETLPDGTLDERARIIAKLSEIEGSATGAAASLGYSRRTFIQKLEQLKIPRPRPRDRTK